jgi:phosphoglycerate dehydrogenase-like enzyme
VKLTPKFEAITPRLSGKTLCLPGLGRIGKRIAEYAKAFGMEVIAWSQNPTVEAAAVGVRRSSFTWCSRSAREGWSLDPNWP